MTLTPGPLVRDVLEQGVERGGLAAAGGAADDDQPLRRKHLPPQPLDHVGGEPQLIQRQALVGMCHQAQHDALAADGREARHAYVAGIAVLLAVDSALLGDVGAIGEQAGEHLQPCRHVDRHHLRQMFDILQKAVDAKTHAQRVVLRLQVQVAGAGIDRPADQAVNELDDSVRRIRHELASPPASPAGPQELQDIIDDRIHACQTAEGP